MWWASWPTVTAITADPGAEGAGMSDFGIENGLTCVLANAKTRDGIFAALKARRCYATTGARILLDFMINGATMGSIISSGQGDLAIQATVTGAAPLESLQLYQGREVVAEVRPDAFANLSGSNHIRISWQGCRERGRQRRATWDGHVRAAGCQIISAETFSFDVVKDGITAQSGDSVQFASKTTGDRDGLDILLDDASQGTLTFASALGKIEIDLAELTDVAPRRHFDLGGVDLQVLIERYPAKVETLALRLETVMARPERSQAGTRTPYFVKATQVDGQMAWASPIYVE